MKDKVASILGESKSTNCASSTKISNSNNEKSSSDKKPLFYRRDNANEKQPEQKDSKRIGNNFRIIRSPNTRKAEEDKVSNIVRISEPNIAAFNRTHYKRNTALTGFQTGPTQLPNMGIISDTRASRNTNFNNNGVHFKNMVSEIIDANQIIHESNKASNDTIRKDSQDPRQKSTPRVEEHRGDPGAEVEQNDTQEDYDEAKQDEDEIDQDVIKHIVTTFHMPEKDLITKLKSGDRDVTNLYTK